MREDGWLRTRQDKYKKWRTDFQTKYLIYTKSHIKKFYKKAMPKSVSVHGVFC